MELSIKGKIHVLHNALQSKFIACAGHMYGNALYNLTPVTFAYIYAPVEQTVQFSVDPSGVFPGLSVDETLTGGKMYSQFAADVPIPGGYAGFVTGANVPQAIRNIDWSLSAITPGYETEATPFLYTLESFMNDYVKTYPEYMQLVDQPFTVLGGSTTNPTFHNYPADYYTKAALIGRHNMFPPGQYNINDFGLPFEFIHYYSESDN